MTLPEDLKDFRADDEKMRRLATTLCIVAVVMLAVTAHTTTYQAEVASEQARREFVPAWQLFQMPPAEPIFEQPHELMRLTPPVSCVRPDGVQGTGREWIRSWGDGALPPAIPNCVNARRL